MRRAPTSTRRTIRLAAARAALAVVALVAAGAVRPAGAQPVAALRDFRWSRRVLVVLAPGVGTAAESTYRAQRRELERAASLLAERDVTVLDLPSGSDARSAARARTLRRQLGVPDTGFAVALVGKDGGVKLRRRTLLSADVVLGTIDAMPMGAAERRRRAAGAPATSTAPRRRSRPP